LLSAFLIALREGVEASLGVAAAVALSLGIAIALDRFRISEDGFEGVMLLVAAAFVTTMIVWMNRVARHLKKEIEQKVEAYAARVGDAAGWGIFLFVFLMVVREGAELALILRAVEMSTEGLQVWIGTLTGVAAAVAVGGFFFKGTLKIPLQRFFAATSIILMLVVFQLAITGLHELSEAQWLPSSKTEMAVVGPIVRNDLFFFVFIFGAAALLVMREWQSATHASAVKSAGNDAEKRLLQAQNRRQRRWMAAAASACLIVILTLTADFIYARANSAAPTITKIAVQGTDVRVPIAQVQDGDMHLFSADVNGQVVRFMIIKKPNGWGTALDACRICGAEGYRQDGQNVICRHCGSAIYVPTIGEAGGCNPIGVPSHVDGANLVLDVSALAQATHDIPN
jgi:FTR1 family protein